MFKKLMLIGVFSICSMMLFGQGKITLKEEATSDLLPLSFYRTKAVGYLFKVDGNDFQGVGFKGEKLGEILKSDEAAYAEFRKFQRKVSIAKAFYWVGASMPLTFLVITDYEDSDEQILIKAISTFTIMIGSYTTTIVLFKNAPKHLHNAVQIYNQNLEK